MSDHANLLKTIQFSECSLWDVKRFLANQIESSYPVVRLGDYISQRSQKIKLNDFPDQVFGILGVSNEIGIFDAYTEKGENINQPYQEVHLNDLVYNPYRINVGSIGLKTSKQNNFYISPAYVVFECQKGLEADFLFKMFKTDTFNQIIRDNTTGSVRQNLKFDILKDFKAPLPTIDEQNRLINSYNQKIAQAEQQEAQALTLEQSIENYFFNILDIEKIDPIKRNQTLSVVNFKNLSKWSIDSILKESIDMKKGTYPCVNFENLALFIKGGKTPSKSRKDFWDGEISWTSPKDFKSDYLFKSEDTITVSALKETNIEQLPVGTFLSVFRSGILRHSFPTMITKVKTTINQDVKAYKLNSDYIIDEYFLYFTQTFKEYILSKASKIGVTVESIDTEEFLSLPI